MYLSIGNDMAVREKSIIGIFDMDNTTVSPQTRNFLAKAQKDGIVIDVAEDLPKSFIITESGGKTCVYISSLASRTLYGRTKTDNYLNYEL